MLGAYTLFYIGFWVVVIESCLDLSTCLCGSGGWEEEEIGTDRGI